MHRLFIGVYAHGLQSSHIYLSLVNFPQPNFSVVQGLSVHMASVTPRLPLTQKRRAFPNFHTETGHLGQG